MKKILAFTLAETLIVMGVIGVVAALTLPNLNQSTNNKEKVAKVKKFYSNFSDAFGRAVAIYGPVEEWFVNDANNAAKTKRFSDRITEFMKLSKTCQTGTGCFAAGKQKKLRGGDSGNEYNSNTNFYKYILADGMSIGFFNYNNSNPGSQSIETIIDIDGPNQGANTFGKDVFSMSLLKNDGTLITGSDLGSDGVIFSDVIQNCFIDGMECTGWIMQTDNMDYIKADSSGKCPNNTQLSETVTSCN